MADLHVPAAPRQTKQEGAVPRSSRRRAVRQESTGRKVASVEPRKDKDMPDTASHHAVPTFTLLAAMEGLAALSGRLVPGLSARSDDRRRKQATLDHLVALPDYLLADIGLTREQIAAAYRTESGPFAPAPGRR